MSFLDTLVDFGKNLFNSVTGSGAVGGIARSAALGFMLKKVTDSINKDNQKPETANTKTPDPGVRLQVNPNTEHAVPVVYGTAYLGGIVTDAAITNSNQTMWYCITICEKTGNLINGTASQHIFEKIYWNKSEIIFQANGVTAASIVDEDGVSSDNVNGLVRVYCYSGNSTSQVSPRGYTITSSSPAYSLFPNWTSLNQMSDLVFVLVRIDYNKEKSITGLPDITFKIKNTMNQPGDVMNDYMTNTRYGAGIPSAEIYTE
jgi:hypothetical protein